jgi:predicted nucleotidyltransferase
LKARFGSAGRGDADFYSDLDLLLYVDELPPNETLTQIRTTVSGTNVESRGWARGRFR